MKTVAISGSTRENVGKRTSKELRYEGKVPAVLYGGKEQTHFSVLAADLRDIVYTPEVSFIELNIDKKKSKAIIQEIQFHPLKEQILHIDFLELFDDKLVSMDIPVRFTGTSPGVKSGGKLKQQLRKLKIKALPKNMPQYIDVSLETLEVGKSIRVGELEEKNYTILSVKDDTIVSVSMSRAMRQAEQDAKK